MYVHHLIKITALVLKTNNYGRVREDRLAQSVEQVAENMVSQEKRVKYVLRQAVGSELKNATPFEYKELRPIENGGGGGNRTHGRQIGRFDTIRTEVCKFHTKTDIYGL